MKWRLLSVLHSLSEDFLLALMEENLQNRQNSSAVEQD
jgi:hypothetical protein